MSVDLGPIDIVKDIGTNKVRFNWCDKYYYYYVKDSFNRLERVDNDPNVGYKRYRHTPDWSDGYICKISSILFDGVQQTGFPEDLQEYAHVDVYYLLCDENNVCPLLVKLVKQTGDWRESIDSAHSGAHPDTSVVTDTNSVGTNETRNASLEIEDSCAYSEYYKIREGNEWTKLAELTKGNISETLSDILNTITSYPTTISLHSTRDYYIDGGLTGPSWLPKVTVVDESNVFSFKTYKKIRHSIMGKRMNIIAMKHGEKYLCFKGRNSFPREHDIKVYYCANDRHLERPLMIAFDYINYIPGNGGRWEPSVTARGEPLDTLDLQNCLINGAHLIDLTKTCTHKCPSCNVKTVLVTKDVYSSGNSGYTEYSFSASGGVIGRIVEHGSEQFTAAFANNVEKVSAYYFNGTITLLRFVSGSKTRWYKQNHWTGNRWKRLTKNLPTESYRYSILSVLENVHNEDLGAMDDPEMQAIDFQDEEIMSYKNPAIQSTVILAATVSAMVLVFAASKCYLLFAHPLRDVAFKGVHIVKRLMQ